MSSTLHITRKRGIYYRRRLPGAGTEEIALSLKTAKFQVAAYLSADLNDALQPSSVPPKCLHSTFLAL